MFRTYQLMQVLCCDWLLEVRAGVWEASGGTAHAQVRAFQRDLHSLRHIQMHLPVYTYLLVLIRVCVCIYKYYIIYINVLFNNYKKNCNKNI